MRATVVEELLPRQPAWVTSDPRSSGHIGLSGTSSIPDFLSVIVTVSGDLRALVLNHATRLCLCVPFTILTESPSLGRRLLVTVCTWSVPVRKRAYEGLELVYLGRAKPASGFTHTSNSKDPPEC